MFSSLRLEYGKLVTPRTRMCGVTSQCFMHCATRFETEGFPSREVKFGALMKHLGNSGEWLATGITLSPSTS